MKKLLWMLFLYCFETKAVNFPVVQGPVSHAFGNISSLKNDPFAASNHAGCLAMSNNNIVSFSVKSPYFMPELNTFSFAAQKHIKKTQALGLGYSFFGNQHYNESLLKLCIAKKITNKTGGGISLDYYRLQLPKETFSVKNIITFEIGFYSEINKNFDIALQLINPAMVALAEYKSEKLPFVANSTIFYKINNQMIIGAEWCQTVNGIGYPKFGLRYDVSNKLEFYCGFNQKPVNASIGFCYNYKNSKISLAFSTHPYLNSSSSAGISFCKPYDKK